MKKYIPNMYQKNILNINYDKLKKNGIKCLIFDLDNTIALLDENKIPTKVVDLFNQLKKDFTIVVASNNVKKRIKPFYKSFNTIYFSLALKPLSFIFRRISKKLNFSRSEMCVIGDQLITDILGGNNFGAYTILVDPLGKKDLKITSINRFFEKRIINKLTLLGKFERGKYYE